MIQDTPNGQTQYLVDGEPVAMSQEDKPVAAQKPVARIDSVPHLERDGLYRAEVTLTRKLPAFTDLYANAAPCARCAEKDQLIAEQNKLNKERQEWALHTNEVISGLNAKLAERDEEIRIIRSNLAKLEKDFDRRNERIEALEAEVERLKSDVEHYRFQADESGMERVRYGKKLDDQTATIERHRKVVDAMKQFLITPLSVESCKRMRDAIAELEKKA